MHKLVKQAQKGDPKAFTELIEAHKNSMYRVAKGFFRSDEDAADAIQETILACYEHISELRETRYFKTWLIRILINKCSRIKRANERYVGMVQMPERGAYDQGQANAEFMMLMDTLDEGLRVVLILYYAEQMRVRDICTATGLSESAIKARLKRGREKAKKIYDIQQAEVLL